MGSAPADTAALPQQSLAVQPTRTVYVFAGKAVRVTLTFLTPTLPWDLDLLSRPVTYISWEVASTDGGTHDVQVYFDCGAEIAVNTPDQAVQLDYPAADGLSVARVGTPDQPVLARQGDDVRIDWGYGYLAAAAEPGTIVLGGNGGRLRRGFIAGGALPAPAGLRPARSRPAPRDGGRVGLGAVGRRRAPGDARLRRRFRSAISRAICAHTGAAPARRWKPCSRWRLASVRSSTQRPGRSTRSCGPI
jgi:hypothetical protein